MLIGINGKIGSGKDTVGKIIQYLNSPFDRDLKLEFNLTDETYEASSDWNIKKFAGKLKQIATLLTGVPIEKWEDQSFKKQEMPRVWEVTKQVMEADENNQDGYSTDLMTYREFLQKLGTEAMRNGLHENTWVNALFADYESHLNWIITDMRFPNEYDAVRGKQGICIRVEKPCQYCNGLGYHKISCVKLYQTQHASETALDNHVFDYVINNTGTIDDLVKEVRKMLLHFNLLKA